MNHRSAALTTWIWLGLGILSGCHGGAVPPRTQAVTAPARPGACRLVASALPPPRVAPALLAVAPQYFHAYYSGGFDAYRGGPDVFPWFDAADLEHPTIPPAHTRIAASTSGSFLTVGLDGELGLLRRGATHVSRLGERLYPEVAVEAPGGEIWATARSGSGLRLLHITAGGRHDVRDLGLTEDGRVATLALSASGRPALVWFARAGGRLSLRVSWTLDPAQAVEVDHVDLPAPVARLAVRSGVDLAAAADGAGIAVAWRPLTDKSFTDVGSVSVPPQSPARAEVRWRSIAPDGTLGALHRHATLARPLEATTGVGPWGLAPSGMKATTLRGHAMFVWVDGDAILAARAAAGAATRLAASEGAPLVAFRGTEDARELLLLDSSPRVRAFRLTCHDPTQVPAMQRPSHGTPQAPQFAGSEVRSAGPDAHAAIARCATAPSGRSAAPGSRRTETDHFEQPVTRASNASTVSAIEQVVGAAVAGSSRSWPSSTWIFANRSSPLERFFTS